jgi:hypothetical protein
VKFLFATTEVEQGAGHGALALPALRPAPHSRAEMLPRISPMICGKEGVAAEAEALALVAQAAEGSVRDGLSILDQAIAHADLDPGELARLLQQGGVPSQPSAPAAAPPVANAAPAPASHFPGDFRALVDALDRGGHANVAATLHDVVRLVRYAPPQLEFQLAGPVHQGFGADLNDALFRLTGTRWEIAEGQGEAQPSLHEQEQAARAAHDNEILESPLVRAALDAFPEAEVHVDGRTIHSPHEAEIRSRAGQARLDRG